MDILSPLLRPHPWYDRPTLVNDGRLIPEAGGIYAWYFDEAPPEVPVSGCHTHRGWKLLYVGISPSRPVVRRTAHQTLRKRLQAHLSGNAEGSTLRRTLGILLAETLGIALRRVGSSGRRMTFTPDGEARLSAWMDRHVRIAWLVCDTPWALESVMLETCSLPLNLKGNDHHPFAPRLKQLRKAARVQAAQLPIVR